MEDEVAVKKSYVGIGTRHPYLDRRKKMDLSDVKDVYGAVMIFVWNGFVFSVS